MSMVEEHIASLREDVAYIKAKIDALPDHETRIRSLERWKWGMPVTWLATLGALLTALLGGSSPPPS